MDLLDPKLDVVFKLLLTDPRNERLLVSLITAVLRPPSPIASVTVINPEIGKQQVDDKGIVLDVLVALADGRRVNIEMQCNSYGAKPERWVYQWARIYAEGMKRGESVAVLVPVVCIVLLDVPQHRSFHEIYRMLEVNDGRRLTSHFELHLVELPQVAKASSGEVELRRWARFLLRATEPRELESLATEDPIMAEAKEALERLSAEPSAQVLAAERRRADILTKMSLAEERAAGREEGRQQGREEGRQQGRQQGQEEGRLAERRESVRLLAGTFGVSIDEHIAELEAASFEELEVILRYLAEHRAWPPR